MAEVGQKLGSGASRLSALRSGQTRPVSTGRGSGALSASGPVRDRPVAARREEQPVSERRASGRKPRKLWTVRKSEIRLENTFLLCAPAVEMRFMGFYESRGGFAALPAALRVSSACAGRSQERLLSSRTLWTPRPDPLRSPQHPRALCTVVLVLALERPGCGLRRLRPEAPKRPAAARSYSRGSGEAPLLHRSRTAYYDVLRVSPTATQAQIKTAYYKQSFIYHPDKNPGDKDASLQFSAVSEAYTVLGNISLRRKYDRGILSQSDVQTAGRPSSKEQPPRSSGSSQQQQQRARTFTRPGGKPVYDFDAFYQAHYGEQLQKEREMRARKQEWEEIKKKRQSAWRDERVMDLTLTLVVAMGGLLFISLLK